ncbi:MAG: tetratricopeptide repeat protein [Pseudomonadota bacterium]
MPPSSLHAVPALLGATLLVLSACTTSAPLTATIDTVPAQRLAQPVLVAAADDTGTPANEEAAEIEGSTTEDAKDKEEYGNFTEDQLSRAILAELAGQRGQNDVALTEYVALARETGNVSIIQRAMRIAAFSRQPNVAIEMAELWLSEQPDSVEARQTVALELVSLSRYRDAFDQFEILLDQGEPVDFRLLSARIAANAATQKPALTGLIEDYAALLQRYPTHDSLRLSLSHLYQLDKQPAPALALIRQMLQEAQQRERSRLPAAGTIAGGDLVLLEVQLLDIMEDTDGSLRELQKGVRSYPQHKDLRYMYGRRLINDRKYPQARAEFAILVEQNPKDYDLLYSLALLSMEVNLYAEAKNYLQLLVVNGQKLDDAHYYLGFIEGQENNAEQAIEHYMLVKAGSNFTQALRNLTEQMIRADRYDEVHTHLQNIRFRNSDLNIPLLAMEANVLIDEKQYALAGTILNNSVGAFPNNVELLFLRSVLSQEQNDLALMEADLRKIILLEPQSPVAYNSLGYTLADRTDRYQEAYDLIAKAAELAPNDPAIIDSLGWVQYKLGMYQQAKDNLDRAYQLYPDAEVAAHLGEVLWVMGDKTAATRVWRGALATQPDSVHLRDTMQRLDPAATR